MTFKLESSKVSNFYWFVKLGLSEKHTRFEKNLPHGFDKSADLLSKWQNHEEDFSNYVCFSKSSNFKAKIIHSFGMKISAMVVQ